MNIFLALCCLIGACTVPAGLKDTRTPELAAMSPSSEPVSLGLAGEDPADIGRFLLASGAQAPSLSPDGETVAFRWLVTGRPQLWTIPAEGGQPRRLTYGRGVTFFEWSPDGSTLLYGADNHGNEQESYFLVGAKGGHERILLAAAKGGFRVFGGFADKGDAFAYASTERNGLDFDIYVADVSTGDSRMVYQGKFGFFVQAISPDGTTLVVSETVGEDADNLYLIDVESGHRTTVSAPQPRANHTNAGVVFRADSKSFYFGSNADRQFSALIHYDLGTQKHETLFAAEADVESISVCGPNDRYLVWLTNEDGFNVLHAQIRESGESLSTPSLPEGRYTVSCSSRSSKLSIGVNGWSTPGDIVVWDMASKQVTTAFGSDYAGIERSRLVRPEPMKMKARDGVQLQGLLYLPDEASRAEHRHPPIVFDVHGGPTGQSRPIFNPVVQYLVDRGIAVFQPNVRGSTGFGRTYSTLDDREKRLDSVRDLVDMHSALQQDGRVDTSRAAVRGGSYGGYMVNAVLSAYPKVFKAGVSLYGVANWVTALQIASPALKASDRVEYGDIADPKWQAFYETNSPIRQANHIQVPVLYSHGVMDPRIDIAETETMVRALRANGVQAQYIRIPDEGHGWRKLSNRLYYFRREAAFLGEVFSSEGSH